VKRELRTTLDAVVDALLRSEPCHSTSIACSDAPAAAANARVRATASAISGRTLDDSIECEIHVRSGAPSGVRDAEQNVERTRWAPACITATCPTRSRS
jgi:hypothetical protein